MTRLSARALFNLGVATAALTAIPAWAQDQAPAEQAAESSAGDLDIVVTARRREENLLDVPVAITAYSGDALERQGAIDITEISDTTPNITVETSRGTNSTLTAFIRGVGQQDPVAGFESGVGLYLDDVYLNRPQAAVLDIYDVQRIEVLRGPQGTLYGRNTIGGAIKYVTRELNPTDAELSVRANLGEYDQADLVVSGSAPLTPDFRLGASLARLSRGGFGKNLTTGQENYNKDVWAFRATAEAGSRDSFFFRLSGDYTHDRSNTRGGHRLIPSLLTAAPVLADEFDSRGGLVTPKQDIKAWGIANRLEWAATDNITLKNILAYRKDRSATPIDFDALPAADVDVPAIYRNRQFSEEFQVVYESDKLNGIVGAYYLNARARNIFDVVLATTGALIGAPGFTASTAGDVRTKTWAVFGDITYDLTDQFQVSLGGRYTSDKRNAVVIRKNLVGGASPELGGAGVQLGALTSNFAGEKTFKEFTPRASVTFKPTEDHTLYASYSKGFKGGGFDPRGLSTAAPDINGNGVREASEIFDYFLFDPEKVDSYEIGWKASLFDNRLRFALAGFYADYKDVQVPGSVGAIVNGIPTFVGVTTNAGKATFKGVEFEGQAVLARDFAGAGSRLNLSGTLGYIDAQYDRFETQVANFNPDGTPAAGRPGQPVDVAKFRRIQNTPKWTASGTLDFGVPVGPGRVDASTTLSYRSKTFQFETPSPYLDQPGYALWDASLVWTSEDDRYTIGLHAKNITDKRYIVSGYQFLNVNPVTGQPVLGVNPAVPATFAVPGVAPSLGREGVVTAFYGNPRQLFVSFGLKF
ncbi:TonB-dependent receptor [Sphingomonas sp. ID1715]|uniref:TonB-dependent receptor n=1 Tax=Sphingomonas sp. ID1715 TaxID=1656898 RepID=UPI00148764DF|nr:TonB-dependent receptor [Sphingomonas sp. ID1715]NNM77138.1 TonB-dependent receptor [Sphingomonas sp. ID1715]